MAEDNGTRHIFAGSQQAGRPLTTGKISGHGKKKWMQPRRPYVPRIRQRASIITQNKGRSRRMKKNLSLWTHDENGLDYCRLWQSEH